MATCCIACISLLLILACSKSYTADSICGVRELNEATKAYPWDPWDVMLVQAERKFSCHAIITSSTTIVAASSCVLNYDDFEVYSPAGYPLSKLTKGLKRDKNFNGNEVTFRSEEEMDMTEYNMRPICVKETPNSAVHLVKHIISALNWSVLFPENGATSQIENAFSESETKCMCKSENMTSTRYDTYFCVGEVGSNVKLDTNKSSFLIGKDKNGKWYLLGLSLSESHKPCKKSDGYFRMCCAYENFYNSVQFLSTNSNPTSNTDTLNDNPPYDWKLAFVVILLACTVVLTIVVCCLKRKILFLRKRLWISQNYPHNHARPEEVAEC